MAGVSQLVREPTVVGQQQQTFAILVQPSSRIDVLLPDEVGQRAASVHIGKLTQHPVGFVECDQHARAVSGLRAVPQWAEAADAGAAGLTKRSVIRSDSPIARYFALSCSPRVSVGGKVHTPLG